ncbi:hypothetical protein ABH926_002951 [Catenulispora sp. GP43]|uniref:L-tyrosine/L-tryptophan isonitrile synthase family protein n=1 Tax=Catenulispora sp. GP43 TaxID=3156263 RepID=UPI0035198296
MGWTLRDLILTDPLLRMYCAVPDGGSVWPPHPGFPEGTRALPMDRTGPHTLWQAAEYVMRPLAIVARAAGEYGAVVDLDPARFTIEVDRAGRPTGRVVAELLPDADGDASLPDWLLARCVGRLADRCVTGGQEVRAWLRAVADHELDETVERPEAGTVSNTRSISQLRLSELSSRPTASSHAVWLTTAQTKRLTGQLVRAAVRSGEQTAERVTQWGRTLPDIGDEERIARLIHRILSRKQFRRGSMEGYPAARAIQDMLPAIKAGEPIHAVLPAFPVKQADSGLKAFGALPDFAEFAFLVRLKELHAAVSRIYEPGLRVTLVSDAQHYRARPVEQARAYAEKISEYIRLAEASDFLELRDIDDMQPATERPNRLAAHIRALTEAFGGLDIATDPVGTLRRSVLFDPAGLAASAGQAASQAASQAAGLVAQAARAKLAALADLAAATGSDTLVVLADLAAFAGSAILASSTASAGAAGSGAAASADAAGLAAGPSAGAAGSGRAAGSAGPTALAGLAASGSGVAALFSSLIHSVPVPLPDGADRSDWSARVYADVYRTGDSVPPTLAAARSAVLRAAWEAAIRYVAVLRTDQELGHDQLPGAHLHLTAATPGPGQCGFAGLGGSALLPWHGTAAVDRYGVVSTDFAISLLDRAFVPVYADALGDSQPWFMAPICATDVANTGPARLSDAFLDGVRLRRH